MTFGKRNRFGDELVEHTTDWIQENLDPIDVFSEEQLIQWAEKNGFILQSDSDAFAAEQFNEGFEAGKEAASST